MEFTDRQFIVKFKKLYEEYENLDVFSLIFLGLAVVFGCIFVLKGDKISLCFSWISGLCCIGFFRFKNDCVKPKFITLFQMNVDKAKCHYEMLLLGIRNFSMIQRVCDLNPDAMYSQRDMVKNLYGINDDEFDEYFAKKRYSELDIADSITFWKSRDTAEKKAFADTLFKFVILEDGIHNDEWNLLMEMMTIFKLNKNYIAYFKKRYGPLRTEFDEDEKTSSTNSNSVATNNPYYAILGLNDGATDDEIKRAYHNLALQHHPDLPKNADRIVECEEMMAKINEAYEKIRN